MELTGDDGSETELSVPDDVFQRSSSAVGGAEDDVQYAQNPQDDGDEVPPQYRPSQDIEQAEQSDPGSDIHESDGNYSDEESDRENRFQGSASNWRFYTESERALAASLDQERANDLSIHLYNAHALKASVRDPDAAAKAKHHQGKKRWIKADEDGMLPWHPDENWTAWPLKPEDVPRKGERFGVAVPSRENEKATYSMLEPWKPSADLEGEIQAIMMRKAKDQLRERQQHRQRVQSKVKAPQNFGNQMSPRKRRRSSSTSSDEETTTDESEHDDKRTSPPINDEPVHEGEDYDLLVDDDDATEILQPSVQHIVSQLDNLLLGLHKSRQAHSRTSTSPRSRSKYQRRKQLEKEKQEREQREKEDGDAANDGENFISNTAQPSQASNTMSEFLSPDRLSDEDSSGTDLRKQDEKANRRGRSRSKTAHAIGGLQVSTDIEAEDPNFRSPSRKRGRKLPLNPRDWSEVLGVASSSGWDPAVVQRAAERCSSLFGESMSFAAPSKPTSNQIERREDDIDGFIVEDEEELGYVCPIDTCQRHTEPWPLKKTWRWREHLKRSHKYSKEDVEVLEAEFKVERQQHAMSDALGCGSGEGNGDGHAADSGTAGERDTRRRRAVRPADGFLQPIQLETKDGSKGKARSARRVQAQG